MIKPIFTEKSLEEAKKGRYSFYVSRNLNKYQIKNLISSLFNVAVIRVSTVNYKGETRRTIRGQVVRVAPYKKAVVSLKSGDTISLWEAPKKEEKKSKKIKKENK